MRRELQVPVSTLATPPQPPSIVTGPLPTPSSAATEPQGLRRRISPHVALVMMETLRSQDLPGEILADEDVTLTLPRRLGLSEVVDAQIRRYREEVRRRSRVSDEEFLDLMRLVLRRPDAKVLFRRVGEELAGVPAAPGAIRKLTPAGLSFRLGRRRIRSRLRSLFGRDVVVSGQNPTQFKAAISLFQLPDGGKAAAEIVSGLAYATLSFYTGKDVEVDAVWEAEATRSGLIWEMKMG